MEHTWVLVGIFGPFDDRFNPSGQSRSHLCRFGLSAGGSADAVEVFHNIADVKRIQRKNLRLFGQSDTYLGNLPRRDGSNLTDCLGYQQVWFSCFQQL